MWRPLTSALVLSLLLSGCEEESCPGASDLQAGSYSSTGGRWVNGPSQFPHDGPAKRLTVERGTGNAGTVKVTYTKNGKVVVETWALAGARWGGP